MDDRSVVVALTYGPNTDWLKNLRKAGRGLIVIGSHPHPVGAPELVGIEGMDRMPTIVRPVLYLLDINEFVVFPLISPDRST